MERISEERYQAMAPGYEREQSVLKGKRDALAAEIAHSEEVYDNIERFLPIIWKYTNITELNARILNELIERIDVHEKVITPDGIKSQQIDIHYKFIGYFDLKEMMKNGVWCQDSSTDEFKPILVKPEDLFQ